VVSRLLQEPGQVLRFPGRFTNLQNPCGYSAPAGIWIPLLTSSSSLQEMILTADCLQGDGQFSTVQSFLVPADFSRSLERTPTHTSMRPTK
jgi:hypothetical protein